MTNNSALLISTKYRYSEYIDWFIKNRPKNETMDMRLSSKKLITKINNEQFILLLRKFHPWQEELNRVILMVEASGLLGAWGDKPLKFDVSQNPFSAKKSEIETKAIGFRLMSVMFLPLAIGLVIGLVTFTLEFGVFKLSCRRYIPRWIHMTSLIKSFFAYAFLIALLAILAWNYLYEEEFQPAIGIIL